MTLKEKSKERTAAPDEFTGNNPNTPVRRYDTHPNERFAVGEEVIPLDPAEPPVRGTIMGHAAEDRVWVQWPHTVSQEDVDDLVGVREWAYVGDLTDSNTVGRPGRQHDKERKSSQQDSVNDLSGLRTDGIETLAVLASKSTKPVSTVLRNASLVAKSLHVLYTDPKHRAASVEASSREAMKKTIIQVLAAATVVRESNIRKADLIEVAAKNAFTYPRG